MDAIEEYLQQVKARLFAEPMMKEAIASELRSHLWEKVRDLQDRRPDVDELALQREVIDDFGTPEQIAEAYNPEGSVVVASGGKRPIVLTVDPGVTRAARKAGVGTKRAAKRIAEDTSRAAAKADAWLREKAPKAGKVLGGALRGIGHGFVLIFAGLGIVLAALWRALGAILKWVAIVLLVVVTAALASASVAAVFLFDDVRDEIAARDENTALSLYASCLETPCTRPSSTTQFYVNPNANRLTFYLDIDPRDRENGTVAVTVQDPNGQVVLDRAFEATTTMDVYETHRWSPVHGDWTVTHSVQEFRGRMSLHAEVRGI